MFHGVYFNELRFVQQYFMWKWNNQHVTSVGQRKNLRPRQDSSLWPPKHRAGALSTCATEDSWTARPFTRFIFDVLIFLPYSTISTLLILAVCRTHVKYEPSIYCLALQIRGLRYFLCPTLVTCLFHFHICLTEQKNDHLSFFPQFFSISHWKFTNTNYGRLWKCGLLPKQVNCKFKHRRDHSWF